LKKKKWGTLTGCWVPHDTRDQVVDFTTREEGHGRREERTYTVITHLEPIRDRLAWPGLKVVGMCCRTRICNGQETTEVHYFIGSRRMTASQYAEVLRNHWSIENHLHWQLDISFTEDRSRIHERNAAQNFAMMRKLALSLLKRHPEKLSIRRKRKKAALDPAFLAATLTGAHNTVKI
jgi:predicted transposase YbfD/YdcC